MVLATTEHFYIAEKVTFHGKQCQQDYQTCLHNANLLQENCPEYGKPGWQQKFSIYWGVSNPAKDYLRVTPSEGSIEIVRRTLGDL